jgi:hypothetical protein
VSAPFEAGITCKEDGGAKFVLCFAKITSERNDDSILELGGCVGKDSRLGSRRSETSDHANAANSAAIERRTHLSGGSFFNSAEKCSHQQLRQPDHSDDEDRQVLAKI